MSLLLLFAGATTGGAPVVMFPVIVRATTDRLTPDRTTETLVVSRTMTRVED